jgi:hypothetical protein
MLQQLRVPFRLAVPLPAVGLCDPDQPHAARQSARPSSRQASTCLISRAAHTAPENTHRMRTALVEPATSDHQHPNLTTSTALRAFISNFESLRWSTRQTRLCTFSTNRLSTAIGRPPNPPSGPPDYRPAHTRNCAQTNH